MSRRICSQAFFTIGVYGTSESTFFGALRAHGITHFIDIRRRRGLRGHEYAYANATALQERMAEMGIAYAHCLELAPTEEIRAIQAAADAATRATGHTRGALSPEFVKRYRAECLSKMNVPEFLANFPSDACLAFFCVEREPEICHRSLVAQRLSEYTGRPWTDITPGEES